MYFGKHLVDLSSHNYIQNFKNLDPNSIIPFVKTIPNIPALEIFRKISREGEKQNSILLESAEPDPLHGNKSICSAEPCLNIIGRNQDFEIKALNDLGENFIEEISKDLEFCDELEIGKKFIKGKIPVQKNLSVSEAERLHIPTHFDVLRKISFKYKSHKIPISPFAGLFGVISYDFIDQFEQLPPNGEDLLNDPLYEMNFYDNLFFSDYLNEKTYLVSVSLPFEGNAEERIENCIKRTEKNLKILNNPLKEIKRSRHLHEFISDTTRKDYEKKVNSLKEHILNGDIFQAVLSRSLTTDIKSKPLQVYEFLRKQNPSPYMFYFRNSDGYLLGSSPETSLNVVEHGGKHIVEVQPIAGTRARGYTGKNIDNDLDSRLETELRLDEKELAEHSMLLDLFRNDVARISKTGTRKVINPFAIEKYSHVQHLVSTVQGELKEGLDVFHAYLACMNIGTLTGAPKVEAMKLIRKYENNARGFYAGSIGYITPTNEMDTAIIIRSIRIKNNKAYIRTGGGIVFDSEPGKEFIETEKKASACINAINLGEMK